MKIALLQVIAFCKIATFCIFTDILSTGELSNCLLSDAVSTTEVEINLKYLLPNTRKCVCNYVSILEDLVFYANNKQEDNSVIQLVI